MILPALEIGDKKVAVPIIQGGMGIGVSRSSLAAAVANAGGAGIISGVQIGFQEPDFITNTREANIRALRREIQAARSEAKKGIIGVNILTAMTHYPELVRTAAEEGADLIICGAGLPVDLPKLTEGYNTKNVPVVSSGKAAFVISKMWDRHYNVIPDAVIVEGPLAGGHLGFSEAELGSDPLPSLFEIVRDVISALKPFEEKYNRKVPVIAAGGIFTGEDIVRHIKNGASGVQMATRFVATHECDADIKFKQAYVNAKKEDIKIVKSPVGMPGRAINNTFIKKTESGRVKSERCYNCLKPCSPGTTPYCISDALINAVKGNVDEGLIFTGENAYRVNHICSVSELMQELVTEALEI
ncbi:MAG: nitronate monooxygenase family protein [Bacillota bacterium]|nr:nitronate monooxygenase family protein [Bacillota bacterium]